MIKERRGLEMQDLLLLDQKKQQQHPFLLEQVQLVE